MCNLSKGVYDRAVDKTLVESIKNLINNSGWDIDKCMTMIDIPENKKKVYKEAILSTVEAI